MPTIEITDAQAKRLSLGMSITVDPPLKHLIAVRKDAGTVYEIVDAVLVEGRYTGRWRLLRYGSGRIGSPGFLRHGGFPLHKYTFVEIG